ncbi:MAG: prolyl oligopeptidase family serine peptidase [Bryobacteraceae bacterium]
MRILCLLLAALGALAQIRTPITHEKVWTMKRVGAPALSPDGRWAVVSVTEPAYDASQQVSDLWLVSTDSSRPPRRLTSTKAPESGVDWSADSKRIAFSSRREGDEVPQIYVMDMDGGEAWRLTGVATGASGPLWRPDGKAILFQSEVYPGANTPEENARAAAARRSRATSARVWDSYPIARWDRWLTDVHPHLLVQELSATARPLDLLAYSDLAGQPGFSGNPTADGGEDLEPAWSPDGEWIVFVASTDRDQVVVAQPTTHLYYLNVHGGQAKAITSGPDSYESPVFSPDGKALYASHTRGGKDVLYSHSRIAKISWPDVSKPQILGAGFDRPIIRFRPSSDGSTLYLVAEDAGRDKLYSLAAAGGEVRPVTTGAAGVYSGLEVATRSPSPVLIANWQSMISPPEVVRVDLKSGEHALLTSFTREAASAIDWQPPREFWFTAKNGKRIHSFLVLPPAFDESKKYPLLVFMHGGPHQAWKDQWFLRWNYHLLASPGYVVLMTNYTGSPGYGEKFATDINQDVLRGPAGEINEAADEAIRRFGFIDGARQAAGGASYGGYLANWMAGNTTRYRCLFSHAGLTNNVSMWGTTDGGYYWELRYGGPVWKAEGQWRDQDPLRYAHNFKTPMLVTHGGLDLRVPLGQGLEMFKLLQRMKVPSRLVVFPDENHWIQKGENAKFFFEEVFAWLKKYL